MGSQGAGANGRMSEDTIPCAFGATKNAELKSVSRPVSIRALSGVCPALCPAFVRGLFEPVSGRLRDGCGRR
jgi:hypothetical protein